jgi:hypothetical protein
MRIIFFTLLLLAVQACTAKSTPQVFHSHTGRIHQHSLPPIGVSHRHGAGQAGVIARSTNTAPTISSSVVYDDAPSQPQVVINSHVEPNNTLRINYSKGDTRCQRGEADCNVCAANVQQQFQQASAGRINWRKQSWGFTWAKQYPPHGTRPLDIFDGVPAYPLGIPNKHIQGFARTNSSRFPFVGTHSHKRKGGVFVVSQDGTKMNLSSLQKSKGGHPSGIQVIGDYLVYGDGGALVFKDINSPNQTRTASIKITPKARFGYGGGLGLLRLSKNNLLVLTSGPGSQDSRPRYNYFYQLEINRGIPKKLTLINRSQSRIPAKWPKVLGFSENLSLITECGTGDIYSVHTMGSAATFAGNGYWRLSKMLQKQGNLSLSPIAAFATKQNMPNCSMSSAATVHVNQQHKLEFYCHGFAKDPSGSTFNVLGSPSRNGQDKFDFKMGTL